MGIKIKLLVFSISTSPAAGGGGGHWPPATGKKRPVEGHQGIAPATTSILLSAACCVLRAACLSLSTIGTSLYKRKGKGAKNNKIKTIFKKVLTSENHVYYNAVIDLHNDQGVRHVYKVCNS